MTPTPQHQGTPIKLAGREYILPAMLFSTRKRVKAGEQAIRDGATGFDFDDVMAKVVFETLLRNYPDLNEETFLAEASYEEIVAAFNQLDLEEARRLAELGKLKQARMMELSQSLLTISSPPSSASSAAPGASGSGS